MREHVAQPGAALGLLVELDRGDAEDVGTEDVLVELNTDYSTRGLTANEVVPLVQAWQSGALSRESMLDIFRHGEVLPEGGRMRKRPL